MTVHDHADQGTAPTDPPPSPAAAAPPPADTAGGETGEEVVPDNPELKKLHDEAAKHRVRAKDAEAKVDALTGQVRTLTLRLAFNSAATSVKLTDIDAAWKLAADDLTAVDVAEDGSVDKDRLGQIVAHVAERYPYLTSAPTPAAAGTADHFPPTGPSGHPTNGAKKDTKKLDEGALVAKFPALARGLHGR